MENDFDELVTNETGEVFTDESSNTSVHDNLALAAQTPDKLPQSAAQGYGDPRAVCPLQIVEKTTGYGCKESQECKTEYEEKCSTS